MAAEKISNAFQTNSQDLDLGVPDSLRNQVLTWVLHQSYDKAIDKLNEYISTGSEYPEFHEKTSRFVVHCIDLVYAIRAKRNFPGINSLTHNKQKELGEKYKLHMKELQATLMRIEQIYENLRIHDVRSTVYVVKAFAISGFAIFTTGFALELYSGAVDSSVVVFVDLVDRLVTWILS